MKVLRRQKGYLAFIGHRLSGLALALFLPAHFLVLGLALEGEAQLERVIRFSDLPLVKAAEWGLVVLLCLHVSFGLRLLALETLNWCHPQQARFGWIGWGTGFSLAVGAVFIMGVL
ncbi:MULTISPECIES: succinate dehydrogenase [unclassified Brenneria]|uniref:succinate dehydrogenase n=1 Tax=unclassified Brenneria TaxID=2634434 RepID=UPI0029C42BB5|nr:MULTISPECIES: succinate dehydrogenase [unclassified Brenneria]MDX5627508.1 succinate dehydrogenase [Brenneria sp. L3-3Z]MDX5694336.1 succinate dehydrogenase [Brenneria sp. L4-2C]